MCGEGRSSSDLLRPEVFVIIVSSARGASSPRKGPCPPIQINRKPRTFFQPDSSGLQAFMKGASYVGCTSPSAPSERRAIQKAGKRIAQSLQVKRPAGLACLGDAMAYGTAP